MINKILPHALILLLYVALCVFINYDVPLTKDLRIDIVLLWVLWQLLFSLAYKVIKFPANDK